MSKTNQKEGKNLWAPWRMAYIRQNSRKECVFCTAGKGRRNEENLILGRSKEIFVMMNRFPYSYGHLLVSPTRHVKDLNELTHQEFHDLMRATRDTIEILRRCLSPEGFNVGINLGEVAGAGYADHLHIHIVPRWHGDYNFMPVIAETRVISEHLDQTYDRLKQGFDRFARELGYFQHMTCGKE